MLCRNRCVPTWRLLLQTRCKQSFLLATTYFNFCYSVGYQYSASEVYRTVYNLHIVIKILLYLLLRICSPSERSCLLHGVCAVQHSALTLQYLLCCSPGPGLSRFLFCRNEKRDLSFGTRTNMATQTGALILSERLAF